MQSTLTTKIIRKSPSHEELDNLRNSSALTMVGYLPEELYLYIEALQPFINSDSVTVFEATGLELSEHFRVNIPSTVNVFMIDLGELKDIGKLAITLRFQLGFRWLDDVIGNLLKDTDTIFGEEE